MSKKKATPRTTSAKPVTASTKPSRARAGAAANPVRIKDVAQPPPPPKAAEVKTAPASGSTLPGPAAKAEGGRAPFRRPQSLNFAGVGRNDICPCGSGKRFKNCHGH